MLLIKNISKHAFNALKYALFKCLLYSLSIIHKENPVLSKSSLSFSQFSVLGHRLHEVVIVETVIVGSCISLKVSSTRESGLGLGCL